MIAFAYCLRLCIVSYHHYGGKAIYKGGDNVKASVAVSVGVKNLLIFELFIFLHGSSTQLMIYGILLVRSQQVSIGGVC